VCCQREIVGFGYTRSLILPPSLQVQSIVKRLFRLHVCCWWLQKVYCHCFWPSFEISTHFGPH